MTKSELVGYIKRQLGYPTVNVEVTDEQIDDAILDAINEIKPWYAIFKYLTVDVGTHCIDLSEYKVKDVTDVMKVFGSASSENSSDIDPFMYTGMMGYYSTPWYAMYKYNASVMGRQNIHQIISNYAQLHQEQLYSKLATMMEQKVAGTLYENISWKYYDNKLYIDTGVPSTDVVTIEYIPMTIAVEDFDDHDDKYMSYLKKLSVAFTQLIQARVVGKYQTSGSPTSINYSDMRNDANTEINRIREELKENANRFYITD